MNRHRNLPVSQANFCACFTCLGRKYPSCGGRMDSYCTDRRGVQRGTAFPLGGRFPKEGSAFLGTRLSLGKSSVLYLCGADGSRNCSTPRKVWLQLRRSGGKGCPLRGSVSDRKRLAGGAGKHCLSAVSFANKGISMPPSVAASHRLRTTTSASRAGYPSLFSPPSLSGSR